MKKENSIVSENMEIEAELAGQLTGQQAYYYGTCKTIEKISNLVYTAIERQDEAHDVCELIASLMIIMSRRATAQLNELGEDEIDKIIDAETQLKTKGE